MSQYRLHNYGRPLVSFDENLRLMGAISFGRLCGFDAATYAGFKATITHAISGMKWVQQDGTAGAVRGVALSVNGTFIMEDEGIDVNVDYNVGNVKERIDTLVMNHSFLPSAGGAAAYYSVLKGADNNGLPSRGPAVSQPLLQVPIGRFIIPAGAADHTGTKYEPYEQKTLGGSGALIKENETDLYDVTSGYELASMNRMIKSGLFMITTTTGRPTTDSTDWMVIVMRRLTKITQIAQGVSTGKSYSRSSTDSGVTWGAWQSLNASDLNAAIAALQAAVGTLNYTSNNYLTDGQDLTTACSELDAALNAVAVNAIGVTDYTQFAPVTNLIDFEPLASSVERINLILGDRNHSLGGSQQRLITNGENLSSSLRGIDQAFNALPDNENFNTGSSGFIGMRYCSMAAVVNGPPGVATPSIVTTQFSSNKVTRYQKVFELSTGNTWKRVSADSGGTWGAWSLGSDHQTLTRVFDLGAWDMNVALSLIVITPPPAGVDPSKIRGIRAMVRNDAGDNFYNLTNNGSGYIQWAPGAPGAIIFGSKSGGDFDSVNFSNGVINRGYYVVDLIP